MGLLPSISKRVQRQDLVLLSLLSVVLLSDLVPLFVKFASVVMVLIAQQFGDFIYRSYLTLDRDLR